MIYFKQTPWCTCSCVSKKGCDLLFSIIIFSTFQNVDRKISSESTLSYVSVLSEKYLKLRYRPIPIHFIVRFH